MNRLCPDDRGPRCAGAAGDARALLLLVTSDRTIVQLNSKAGPWGFRDVPEGLGGPNVCLPGGLGEAVIETERTPAREGVSKPYRALPQAAWLLASPGKIALGLGRDPLLRLGSQAHLLCVSEGMCFLGPCGHTCRSLSQPSMRPRRALLVPRTRGGAGQDG